MLHTSCNQILLIMWLHATNSPPQKWYWNCFIFSIDKPLLIETCENKSIRSQKKKLHKWLNSWNNKSLFRNHCKRKFKIPDIEAKWIKQVQKKRVEGSWKTFNWKAKKKLCKLDLKIWVITWILLHLTWSQRTKKMQFCC